MGNYKLSKYLSSRMLAILFFGFSSGLPIALVGSTLQAWYKSSGVDIVTIGYLALVGQPYSYKYIWAPIFDRYFPPLLGKRRGWILVAQLLIIITVAIMAFFSPNEQPKLLGAVGLFLAFLSASQDICIDAYRADVLKPDERGLGAALAVEGYRLAMLASGGFAMILADNIGWQQTYLFMSGLMLVGVCAVGFAPEPEVEPIVDKNLFGSIVNSVGDFLRRENAVLLLLLILLYKLGDVFSSVLSTPFLLDLNFSLSEAGTINKVFGLIASLVGVFFGGLLMTRIGLFRSLLLFGVLQGITNLAYMLLAIVGKNYSIACAAFFIESLCGGMGSAALVALLMSLCNPKYTATQYALFTSITAMGRVYVGPASGYMVKYLGWSTFYGISAILALPGIILILYLRKSIQQNDQRDELEDDGISTNSDPIGQGA